MDKIDERNFKKKLASAIVKRERVDYGEHQIARIDPNKDVDAMLEIVDEKNVSTSAMIKGLEDTEESAEAILARIANDKAKYLSNSINVAKERMNE